MDRQAYCQIEMCRLPNFMLILIVANLPNFPAIQWTPTVSDVCVYSLSLSLSSFTESDV